MLIFHNGLRTKNLNLISDHQFLQDLLGRAAKIPIQF